MSAAAPTATAGVAPAKKGKKKLIIVVVAAVVLLALIGGGVLFVLKNKAAAQAAADAELSEDGAAPAQQAAAKPDAKNPPIFLPLDPFVVNLADKDSDRYAQIGITLEVDGAQFAEDMKTYMPAVRNAILMILAHKTSKELLEREGKEALAGEIMREAVRPMGIEIAPVEAEEPHDDPAEAEKAPKKKRKKAKPSVHNPVRHVHFSNFIIQ